MKEESRITTHCSESNYCKCLFAAIHESGHAAYERHCGPRELLGQPVCNARSLMVHESQSRLFEVMVSRSGDFAHYLQPLLSEHFVAEDGTPLDGVWETVDGLKNHHQYVDVGLIRLEADEVSYPLHIILRYEIERALIEGTMEAEDVPKVWNAKMKEYLGLDPGDRDDLGCLQDMHWSQGFFGYFPTYTLGSMFAAQLMTTIKKELGEEEVRRCIRSGELSPIFAKQKEKIWNVGCTYETEDLMIRATGEKLNPAYFREHLERRYLRGED
ncbi:Carboxypeptidase Taq (M32) metallopeptidase, putative [Angomonas deanei]|uniref:Carboxypeptidase Taq (M32) metallopeptidase, putative n=1 Tax=Angomonas deanei TaxID=59799 RepID=A0A7G2C744_9TRYP|nr:Carboxypeptidase Taq (M32) metallopeptidase, putative [Angomonas deanei]